MNKRKWWVTAAILWMVVIFSCTQLPYFTGENTSEAIHKVVVTEHKSIHTPSEDKVNINRLNLVVRKATHITVFGFLALLLFQSVRTIRFPYVLAWLLTVLYAITDEYHQSFMPGRVAAFQDVLFDSFGALLVLSVIYVISRRRKDERVQPYIIEVKE